MSSHKRDFNNFTSANDYRSISPSKKTRNHSASSLSERNSSLGSNIGKRPLNENYIHDYKSNKAYENLRLKQLPCETTLINYLFLTDVSKQA